MILLDEQTATEVLQAFRLLEGRYVGTGRRLSEGSKEIRRIAERSLMVRGGQRQEGSGEVVDTGPVSMLLTTAEAVKALNVSESTLRRLVRNGQVVPTRIGRTLRFRREALDAYVTASTNGANAA